MTENEVIVLVLSLVFAGSLMHRRRNRGRSLDRVLLNWNKRDRLTLRDLLAGGLLVLGITGGGKSSSSGKQISRALVRDRESYGIICAAKPEDRDEWRSIFIQAGQGHRLKVFDLGSSPLRYNVLAEASRNGDARETTKIITNARDALRSGERSRGAENGAFFEQQEEIEIHHAVVILKAAKGIVSAHDLQQFIATAARTPADLASPQWRAGFHNQCVQAADLKRKSRQEAHDVEQAADHWLRVYPGMEERVRSNIDVGVMGTLFVFCNGAVHERLSTTTNFTLDELKRKRTWLLIDTAPSQHGDSGLLIGSTLKFAMQNYVLRQPASHNGPFNVIWCDEAATWFSKFDATYLAQCRSHRGCMIYLAQGIESFAAKMGGKSGMQDTMALLANFGTKVIHALGSVETANWLSSLLGQRLQTHMGGSTQPLGSVFDSLFSTGGFTSSFDQRFEPVLQPGVFLTGLPRMGGQTAKYLTDAIVMRVGRPFSNGENWIHTTFSQR